jgi:transposase-like protein
MTKRTPPYLPEVRTRAVRMALDHPGEHGLQFGHPLDCVEDRLLGRDVAQLGATSRARPGFARPTTDERERIKALERKVRELRQANKILRKASAYFCDGGARPPVQAMIAFIDEHRAVYGGYAKVAFAKLYDRKTALTAADLLNDRVLPFYDEREIKLCRDCLGGGQGPSNGAIQKLHVERHTALDVQSP